MQHALYRMKNNSHLGDCVAVVTKLDNKPEEIGFTRPEIVTFIKPSPNSWKRITSLIALKSEDLFSTYTPFLRVGSECMFGMFGDTHCNCEPERMTILQQIRDAYGVYVHLPQEEWGYITKLRNCIFRQPVMIQIEIMSVNYLKQKRRKSLQETIISIVVIFRQSLASWTTLAFFLMNII